MWDYNPFLMEPLMHIYSAYVDEYDVNHPKLILPLFSRENATYDSSTKNKFFKCVKQAVEHGMEYKVLLFFLGLFIRADLYDLQKFHEGIKDIEFGGFNLKKECANYVIAVLNAKYVFPLEYVPVFKMPFDVYDFNEKFDIHETNIALKTLAKHLAHNIDINESSLKYNDIDIIFDEARKIPQTIYFSAAITDYIDNTQHITAYSRAFTPTPSEVEYDFFALNRIMPIYKSAKLSNRTDVCRFIIDKYALPILSNITWYDNSSVVTKLAFPLLVEIINEIHSFITSTKVLTKRIGDFIPNIHFTEQLMNEIQDSNSDYVEAVNTWLSDMPSIGEHIYKILSRGRNEVRYYLSKECYEFLIFIGIISLYTNKKYISLEKFLILFYKDLSYETKQRIITLIVFSRTILSATDYNTANILYGYLVDDIYESNTQSQEVIMFFNEMRNFLFNAKQEIQCRDMHTLDDEESFFDILFSDGRIDKIIECESFSALSYSDFELFKDAVWVTGAFSGIAGVSLAKLGLSNRDKYDKLPDAINQKLAAQGRCIEEKAKAYNSYFNSVLELKDFSEYLKIIVQSRINQLNDNLLFNSLDTISQAKSNLSSPTDLIDDTINEISNRLLASPFAYTYLEKNLLRMQNEFFTKVCLEIQPKNLLSKLPFKEQNAVHSYLITSQYVYETLSSDLGTDKLDFSPAIIPLTKSLEMLFDLLYQTVKTDTISGYEDFTQRNLTDKSGIRTKEHIQFAAALCMLKRGNRVNYVVQNKQFILRERDFTEKNIYDDWNIGYYLSIEKLKQFNMLEFKISAPEIHGFAPAEIIVRFNDDDNHNRCVLYKVLDFIRDRFRNETAHKNPISKELIDECRSILLQEQYILWILLYILNIE